MTLAPSCLNLNKSFTLIFHDILLQLVRYDFSFIIFSYFTVMMPWMVPYLRFSDDSLKSTFQEQLSLMRKNRLFCDVILQVSNFLCCTLFDLGEYHVSNDENFMCDMKMKRLMIFFSFIPRVIY